MENRKFWYQSRNFALTALAYSSLHAARTSWSNIQNSFNQNEGITGTQFGLINMIFMLCYSLGMYFSGWLGDKINVRYLIFGGMIGTVFTFGSIGLLGYFHFAVYGLIIALFALNGIFQSTVYLI